MNQQMLVNRVQKFSKHFNFHDPLSGLVIEIPGATSQYIPVQYIAALSTQLLYSPLRLS